MLEQLTERLERAAEALRAGDLEPERAAELVEECARLAAEAGVELDRRARAAEEGPEDSEAAGQLALEP